MNKPRIAMHLDESMTDADGRFVPSFVEEGTPGHAPASFHYGSDYSLARAAVDDVNTSLGLSREAVIEIVASSMAASRY